YASLFFFFSSRRRHTRSDRDWSSDVCSSDLSDDAPGPPVAFDGDRGTWGIVRAQTYQLRGNQALTRVYADSARLAFDEQLRATQIGRASCRERGGITVGEGSVEKDKEGRGGE